MSTRWKVALAVVAAVLAVNGGLEAIDTFTGGTPGGPTSSSYATGADGLAAYADLLAVAGHQIHRIRRSSDLDRLDSNSTLVVLDPRFVAQDDALAVRRFVSRGGRLIAGGVSFPSWLATVLRNPPVWSSRRIEVAKPIVPMPELAAVTVVRANGHGSWVGPGGTLPGLGNAYRTLLATATVGSGRALLLADASPLQNHLLASADNAAFGVALAGPADHRVQFLETVHGYGQKTGFAAIPDRWLLLLGGLLLATVLFMLARGRRLGPPEAAHRALPPPRSDYVEALASLLARTRRPEDVIEPLRERLREHNSPLAEGGDIVAVGREVARLERGSSRRDTVRP
jgi:hypothetical protein